MIATRGPRNNKLTDVLIVIIIIIIIYADSYLYVGIYIATHTSNSLRIWEGTEF
jgi:hypothetical protein